MKKIIRLSGYLLLLFLFTEATAQKISVASGSFDALKGTETINVTYNYDQMGVGKFDNEIDYINKKVDEYNKKEPGTGDKWKESWYADRESHFHPRFEEEFNNMCTSKNAGLSINNSVPAKYTLEVKTTFTEPGYNIGISRMNAYIDLEVFLLETGNPGTVLAKMMVKNSPGRDAMGYDFDTGYRIQEAYAKGGKEIAYYIWKNYLK
jgi:hypothetical protein